MRLGPILAIAERDLRAELKGRGGWGMPAVSALLLLPLALWTSPEPRPALRVQGEVPDVVRRLPGVEVGRGGIAFRRVDGALEVAAPHIPQPIREALDGERPTVVVEVLQPPSRLPSRSVFFALVAASTLTGAVSNSIGGERSRHTLQALLSAAVTRREVVVGKWLAWSAFGAVNALAASGLAILGGRLAPGSWLLAMPVVPALTVALGLFLVRRSSDVVAGSSVSLRILPAVLGLSGLVAWVLADTSGMAAALVPLGGALMVAADRWPDRPDRVVVALIQSAVVVMVLWEWTARGLEERPAPRGRSAWVAGTVAAVGLGVTWACLVPGPVLWAWAGNPQMTALLPPERGLAAASLVLLALEGVRCARATVPERIGGKLGWDVLFVVVGLSVLGTVAPPSWSWSDPHLLEAASRYHGGLFPAGWVAPLVVLAQELTFRGALQRRLGWIGAALVWTVAIAPLDPIRGLAMGLILGWVARGGVGAALVARIVATALVGAAGSL